jgi:hypothetical protein
MATSKIESASLASDAVDNTNIDSTLITAQTEKTSLVDADKFLISDSAASGALKYVQNSNLGAGGLVKLGSSSVGASTVTDITFDSIFSSTYESYRLIGFVNADTAGSQTLFRLRASGSDVGASSQYTRIERYTYRDPSDGSSGQETLTGHTSNEWMIAGGGMKSDADSAPCWFDLTIFPNTSRQFFNGTGSFIKNTNARVMTGYVGGITNSNLSPDGIKIFLWSGNIRYAEVSIFGVVQ